MKTINTEELVKRLYNCGFPDVDRNGRIDRAKVVKIINEMSDELEKQCNICVYKDYFDDNAGVLGHWTEHEDLNFDTYYTCSVCGEDWTNALHK